MTSPKTIVTARYTNPGHRNTSPDYTERRASFDLHLSARVCELVGFGLLWELGLAPMPEFAEVSSEHRDGGSPSFVPTDRQPAPATRSKDGRTRIAHDLRRWLPSAAWTDDVTARAITLSAEDGANLCANLCARVERRETATWTEDVLAATRDTLLARLRNAERNSQRVRVKLLDSEGCTSTADGVPHIDGDDFVQFRHPDALADDNATPWCSVASRPDAGLPTVIDAVWSTPVESLRVRELAASLGVDAVTLRDRLGLKSVQSRLSELPAACSSERVPTRAATLASQAVENAAKIAELTAWLSMNAGDDARAGEHGVDVALRLLKRHYASGRAKLPEGCRRVVLGE